jgi:hypothetical protein
MHSIARSAPSGQTCCVLSLALLCSVLSVCLSVCLFSFPLFDKGREARERPTDKRTDGQASEQTDTHKPLHALGQDSLPACLPLSLLWSYPT